MNDAVVQYLVDRRALRRLRLAEAHACGRIQLTKHAVMAEFEVSAATAKRDIAAVRRAFKAAETSAHFEPIQRPRVRRLAAKPAMFPVSWHG